MKRECDLFVLLENHPSLQTIAVASLKVQQRIARSAERAMTVFGKDGFEGVENNMY
jgi:hypothetical protein